jgi:hypothetical protein
VSRARRELRAKAVAALAGVGVAEAVLGRLPLK